VIEQDERGADGGENSQPERRAEQAPVILKISNFQKKKEDKTRGKNQKPSDF
jgi:hypothetical protein